MLMPIFCVNAQELGVLRTDIVVNYSPPSCSINVPNNIYLGELNNGSQQHQYFTLFVSCPDERITTAITALSGTKVLNDGVSTLMISDNGNQNGTYLRLLNNMQYIHLNGNQNEQICRTSGSGHQCYITPETIVHPNDKRGGVKGIITFKVTYPA